MNLAQQQSALLSLLKTGASVEGDPYIRAVAASDHLPMLREIILSWRVYDIEHHCRLTASLLKKRGRLHDVVAAFAATPNLSPFPDRLSETFLQQMSEDDDLLTSCVARLELYFRRVKRGDHGEYTIDWPCDPHTLIANLVQEGPLLPLAGDKPQRMTIARGLPGMVQVSAG